MDRIRNISAIRDYNPFQPTPPAGLGSAIQHQQFEEAVVVDVIVNNEHSNFAKDGYNVGTVKFRCITSNAYRSEEQLNWAYPMAANISQYPLVGEIVYVFRALNRWYYLSKFNVSNRVTSQDLSELISETSNIEVPKTRIDDYRNAWAPKKIGASNKPSLGRYFQDLESVFRLKHYEGDLVVEGRSGHSIRFGSAWRQGKLQSTAKDKTIPWQSLDKDQQPNLLIRVGQYPQADKTVNSTFGQVIEDINGDTTSVWLTTDQIVPIKLSSSDSRIHKISVSDYPKRFDGAGLYLNSDLIVINSRRRAIVDTSEGIHLTTLSNITLDADKDHISWTNRDRNDRVVRDYRETVGRDINRSANGNIIQIANSSQTFSAKNISFVGEKIYIGTITSSNEPLVLGSTLRQALEQLIQILISEPIVLLTGVPGRPSPQNPARIQRLRQWQQQYLSNGNRARILSLDNFTTRQNDKPQRARTIRLYEEG